MVEHVDIAADQIHEPKGIEDALDGQVYVASGGGTGAWETLSFLFTGSAYPIGAVIDYTGTVAPAGWELCYGQGLQRSTYSNLFSIIGVTYGVGDGSTTFNLPDCRGRVVAGKDNMGGTSLNNLTTPINGDNLGATGGTETIALEASQVPELTGTTNTTGSHTHSLSNATAVIRSTSSGEDPRSTLQNPTVGAATVSTASGGSHTHTVTVNESVPTATGHNNLQPVIVLNKIIYHGVF